MTTTEREAFEEAIRADPADDTVRLAFADWLEESAGTVPCPICCGPGFNRNPGVPAGCVKCRGSLAISDGNVARAEFIRVQVALAKIPPEPPKHRHNCKPPRGSALCARCDWLAVHGLDFTELSQRERELWVLHNREWFPKGAVEAFRLASDTTLNRYGTVVGVVSRGFVDEVRLTTTAFVGGECGRCDGQGVLPGSHPAGAGGQAFMMRLCPDCDAGRAPGLAARIGGHPVRRVVLTDLEPTAATWTQSHGFPRGEIVYGWGWGESIDGRPRPRRELWEMLADYAPTYPRPIGREEAVKWYRTEQAARDALECGAAVKYVRDKYLESRKGVADG